jgi:DNA-binding NtrC family response regulator
MTHQRAHGRTARSNEAGADASPSARLLSRLIGRSDAFVGTLRLVHRMAACDTTVLIQGETGTGKELAARLIHYLSARRDSPFLPVNCGAIPDALTESELFGHTRGAYTDARDPRAGVIAQAEGGTLFLDEIEALSARGQVGLLRFLQDREYRPVGGSTVHEANVRVLAASNVNLDTIARSGGYRADLLYRLDVFKLELPPLRARGDDVVLLAEAFVAQFCRQYGKAPRTLSRETVDFLLRYSWPGNVRELENLMHRAVFLSDGAVIELGDATVSQPQTRAGRSTERSFNEAKTAAIARFERAYLAELLQRTRGNMTLAARLSGKERSRLTKLVKKHGLNREDFLRDQSAQ